MSIEIDFKDFEKDLDEYINTLLPRGLKAGMEKACLLVERDAKSECPVDEGILRATITHKVEIDSSCINGYVGTNSEIAIYVHQGTGIYATQGNGRQTPWMYKNKKGKLIRTIGQKPKPFLKNAAEKNKNEIKNIIEQSLK